MSETWKAPDRVWIEPLGHWSALEGDDNEISYLKATPEREAATELREALEAYVKACYDQDIKLGPITGDAEAALAKARDHSEEGPEE